MYISKICNENIGPLEKIKILPELTEKGNPKPILFVGENGSGKSTLISNIVDAFYELANTAYSNAMYSDENFQGKQYFKAILGTEIHIGKTYMFSHIEMQSDQKKILYTFSSGNLTLDNLKKLADIKQDALPNWTGQGNYKGITASGDLSKSIFEKNVICYFGPERYEKPEWMGNNYYELPSEKHQHLSVVRRFAGQIINPIEEKQRNDKTLQWLLDVIADSRPDIEFNKDGIKIVGADPNDLNLLGIARKNVEEIMSKILGKTVVFGLNFRSANDSRFNIIDAKTREIIIPTLDSLSTGQSALFNMFATIVRYADKVDINKSIHLSDIKGVVVIDEVDLHLHSTLQREVLPQLFKLFPKVQFIISTHSPLFVLGMNEEFGSENISVYEMPKGRQISAESFLEFQKAYQYMIKTEKYKEEIEKITNIQTEETLILTEGATDWRHIKAAWEKFKNEDEYSNLSFKLIEYNSTSEDTTILPQINMSSSELLKTCKYLSSIPRSNKIIMIADADVPNDAKQLREGEKAYKNWGNNVYSIVLPVPKHRQQTPLICIEHYYTDGDLKRTIEISGVNKRLYMGCEFDESGLSVSDSPRLLCLDRNSCGLGKINIIDGQEKKRVENTSIPKEQRVNLALTKMAYAKEILNPKTDSFIQTDFSSFKLLFDVIKEIIEFG